MQRLGINDKPLPVSLWLVFSIVCFLPLASSLLVVPRPIIFAATLLMANLILIVIFKKHILKRGPIVGFLVLFCYLFVQYSKTAYNYDIGLGLASIFRYFLFALLIWAISKQLVSERAVSLVQNVAILFCFLAILVGEALGNYIFKNGVDRFMGIGHSPAPLAMLLALVMLILVHRLHALVKAESKSSALFLFYSVSFAFFMLYLYKTGSRQPLLGLFLVISIIVLSKAKLVYSLVTLVGLSVFLIKLGVDTQLFGRIGLLLSRIWESDSIYSIASADTSLSARVNYLIVGVSELWRNGLFFGLGLNSFPGAYEGVTGREGVAPHNDLLLFLVDFGLVPSILFLSCATFLAVIYRRRISSKQLSYFLLWVLGFSLNNFFFYWMLVVLLLFSIASVRRNTYALPCK